MEFNKIRKRNGSYVKFDINKLINAILKASHSDEIDEKNARRLAIKVTSIAEQTLGHIPTVMDLNEIVKEVLLNSKYKKTAEDFILYKEEHTRNKNAIKNFTKGMIDKYIGKGDWKVKENANTGYSIQGLNHYITSGIEKDYWLNEVYDTEIREAHNRGEIHINDLSQVSGYCAGWDLESFLQEGFGGVGSKVESGPPKHFSSALGQIVNFIFSISGEVSGAVAFSNFDTLLAPYIRRDNLTSEQVEQFLQEFVFNMNVATRVGFQSPFSNLTLDLTVPKNYAEKPVMIGNEVLKETYLEYQEEMNILNQALFKVMTKGDAKGRVFTFPIINVSITKDFDWDNPNLTNFWDSLAKYGLPTFSNYVNSDLSPDDAYSMCCRLRLDKSKLHFKGGGQFGASGLTGSIGVVTVNLNRIGYEADSEKEYFELLGQRMEIAAHSLKRKRELIEELTTQDFYPYCKHYLRNIAKRYKGKYWSNHFSTIGLVGGNESCMNFLGKDIGSQEGQEFMIKVLAFMNDKLVELQKKLNCFMNLEQTPAEGCSRSLALKDLETYKDIKVSGTKDNPYLTNSTQLPVNYTDDLFEVLDLQNELAKQYTGGSVVHLWIGETITEHEALKKLIRVICEDYNIPYFTLTPTFSVCPKHGYLFGEHKWCPKCDEEILMKTKENK